MPKKLTVFGVLAAMALGAFGLLRDGDSTYAAHGVAVQGFSADNSICYSAVVIPAGTTVCPGTSGTIAPSADASTQTNLIALPVGSRLTLPITYTPDDWPIAVGAAGSTIGEVSAVTDLLCDFTTANDFDNIDVLAGGPGDTGVATIAEPDKPYASGEHSSPGNDNDPWPDLAATEWPGFLFKHQGVAPGGSDAYVSTIKPMPASYTPISHDKAQLNHLWLDGGPGVLNLTTVQTQPTPLNIVIEGSPYVAPAGSGLRVSVALLAGDPAPPTNSFLCLDSPQHSIATNTQTTTPAVAGLYPRWTVFTSANDVRSGTVTRVVDLMCVNVGGFGGADLDADCLVDTDPADAPGFDGDGDGLADGIEKEFGTSPTLADTDADGSTDFFEMFFFTRPSTTSAGFAACPAIDSPYSNAVDTDCDGSRDRHDNGSDEVPGSPVTIEDTDIDDNCPPDFNPTQVNSDSAFLIYNGQAAAVQLDRTIPSQDDTINLGDACDGDDDNDSIVDVSEASLHTDNGALTNKCRKEPGPGSTYIVNPSDPLDPDSDDDISRDGIECRHTSNPHLGSSRPPSAGADSLEDGAAETFYRTQGINDDAVAQENNPDGDAFLTGDADSDSDNDGLFDGVEVKFYGTNPTDRDTDHDGCRDDIEAASSNSDRAVNAADLSGTAQRATGASYRHAFTDPGVATAAGATSMTNAGESWTNDSGVISAVATNASLTAGAEAWVVNEWTNHMVTLNGRKSQVRSNTATVLTLWGWEGGIPASVIGDPFKISRWNGYYVNMGTSFGRITDNTATVLTIARGWKGGTPAPGAYTISGGHLDQTRVTYDSNHDGIVAGADLSFVAQRAAPTVCGAQLGIDPATNN